MVKKLASYLISIAVLFCIPAISFAATGQVQNVSVSPSSASKFSKIEWTFNLSKEYANPYYYFDVSDTNTSNPANTTWYGVDGVTVDLHIVTASGNTVTVPGFYYQPYIRKQNGGIQVVGKSGTPQWKFRYTPGVAGTHTYYITVQDKEGTTRYPTTGTSTFTVNDSDKKGFVRASTTDPRFFAYENGDSFIPIAAGYQWWKSGAARVYEFINTFREFGLNKINVLRIWDHADYALSVEGAQTVWIAEGTTDGAARGVEVASANVYKGLRSARPARSSGWYQRLAVNEPGKQHKLSVWVRSDNLSGGTAAVTVTSGLYFNTGTTIAQTAQFSGTKGWTQYTISFTPNTEVVSLNLINNATAGTLFIDDVELGPVEGNSIAYSILTDGDFERHFAKDNPNNDPNQNANLARPLGNYFNQASTFDLDGIIEAAEQNNVLIQLCSCSGPWFTWQEEPERVDYSQAWVLKNWQRNFRYRVARWGYSPSILAWELYNEHGHILPGTPAFNFYQQYGNYQKQTDPYKHMRTTSQGSQAFSPGLWSSGAFDLANYHDYQMISRYPAELTNDSANFVYRFAWCLRMMGAYCQGLGVGDGSQWTGATKPWIWGEIGVGTSEWNVPNPAGTTGEGGRRALHNQMWAGLFSPLGSTPINWYYDAIDADTIQKYYSERKAAAIFFEGVDYDGGNFEYLMTGTDKPQGYNGDTITASQAKLRVYGMKRADKKAAYVWVQNRDNTWSNSSSTAAAVSGTITIPGLLNSTYQVKQYDTVSGQVLSTTSVSAANTSMQIPVQNISRDIAIKIESSAGVPTVPAVSTATPLPVPTILVKNGDVNNDGKNDYLDIRELFSRWFQALTDSRDQYPDGKINTMDYAVVARRITGVPAVTVVATATAVPSVNPTVVPTSSVPLPTAQPQNPADWTQFGHDPQRTNFTSQVVSEPWKYKWQWNGADANGKIQASHKVVPKLVQPVTGDGKIYMIAENTVYALDRNTGNAVWTKSGIGTLNGTPVYIQGNLYVPSGDGSIYKFSTSTGVQAGKFTGSGSFSTSLLYDGLNLYAVSSDGKLYAFVPDTMTQKWVYDGQFTGATMPTYSSSRKLVFYVTEDRAGTKDMYLHAVNTNNGTRKWRTTPSVNKYYPGLEETVPGTNQKVQTTKGRVTFEEGWPVVAEQNGIVFVRVQLVWNSLWTWNPFPNNLAAIRQNLTSEPSQQSLFALNMDTGATSFIPLAGNGGQGDGDNLPQAPKPVIKVVDGKEVAYITWRNSQVCGGCAQSGNCNGKWCDGREDATMGEMVLNSTTVPGYTAGDVRFVSYYDIQTDEMVQLTMSGDYIFHNHWLLSENKRITDRSNSLGNSFTNPIQTVDGYNVIWRQCYCPANDPNCNIYLYPEGTEPGNTCPNSCAFSSGRYCANGLSPYGDSRPFPKGFYQYHNNYYTSQKDWETSEPFTITSDNLVIVKSLDGGLIVLENGVPQASREVQPSQTGLVAKINSWVLGTFNKRIVVDYKDAVTYVGKEITITGKVSEIDNHRPKGMYAWIGTGDKKVVVRVFEKDLVKFGSIFDDLNGKEVSVTGTVQIYWPEGKHLEMRLTDPKQLEVLQ